MDLRQSPDQRELQSLVRAVCADLRPDGEPDPAAAGQACVALTELGLLTLRVPASVGGLGTGLTDTAYVIEELGAALLPMSLVTTHLAHTWLPEARADGWQVGAAHLLDGVEGRWAFDAADTVTHLALAAEQLRIVPAPVDGSRPLEALDPHVELHAAAAADLAEPAASLSGGDYAHYLLEQATLHGAYQVGIAQRVLDRSVRYALDRQQFGRPVGSFQAVKHLMADMLVDLEIARSAVLASAAALDDDDLVAAARLAPAASRLANRAATHAGRKAVQVHGGMGFAWEVDIHLYLKRAWSITATSHQPAVTNIRER